MFHFEEGKNCRCSEGNKKCLQIVERLSQKKRLDTFRIALDNNTRIMFRCYREAHFDITRMNCPTEMTQDGWNEK